MPEMKNAKVLVGLVREDVLICNVKHCIRVLSLREHPAPADLGWVLWDGWWLCEDHVEVSGDV